MCGIVGYVGNKQAVPTLLQGLEKLEYRGYDSAGVCVHSGEALQILKTKGRIQNLKQLLTDKELPGQLGIGHTRWATHGKPTDRNSHPHLSASGKIVLVHNGIIENEAQLRRVLQEKGTRFLSETDTEVIANLIGDHYEQNRDLMQAIQKTIACLEGSFALGILCLDLPDTLVAVKKDSPLVVGFGETEHFIASDVTALLPYTSKVTCLEDGELAIITPTKIRFLNAEGELVEKQLQQIDWQPESAQRGAYAHFMLKEIFEQPKAVRDTLSSSLPQTWQKKPRKIWFVACGSAYHVALLGQYTIRQYWHIPAEAMIASEFRYSDPVTEPGDLVILISQSGETADTVAALKKAKRSECETIALVNVEGSTLSKLADQVLYTKAGPEIAVATTKAFSAQLVQIWRLAAQRLGSGELQGHILSLPEQLENLLSREMLETCRAFAERFHNANSMFYIGRNIDYCLCLEGSLKLKEVAYLHSEAYPAGELKHGPIAMIQPGTPVVALVTVQALADKTVANICEVMARGAEVLCIVRESLKEKLQGIAKHLISIPDTHPMIQPSLSVIPLQLFAYYVAVDRGCDVDKPRNLAKSVTVE